VAAYSVRPGTVAARWEDDVPREEKMRRLHALEEVQARIALELNQALVGKTEEVLVEKTNTSHGRQQWQGRNRTNKLVFFPQPEAELQADGSMNTARLIKPGDLLQVEIQKATSWSLQGCAVTV
jgi:tRNA-2-methylthio-N6-dimethylallyladenosine synthase